MLSGWFETTTVQDYYTVEFTKCHKCAFLYFECWKKCQGVVTK